MLPYKSCTFLAVSILFRKGVAFLAYAYFTRELQNSYKEAYIDAGRSKEKQNNKSQDC